MNNTITSKYFFGNEISKYGVENKRVDYATLAKSFNHVLVNDTIDKLESSGYYFDVVNSDYTYYLDNDGNTLMYDEMREKVELLEEEIDELEDDSKIKLLEEEIETLEEEHYIDVFQKYIIDYNGYTILKDYTNELVLYNEDLDIYVWCITHYGTSWDYVLTEIKIDPEEA